MIKEVVLRDFPNWTPEKQLSEFQAYKKLGGFSPFSEADYALMEMVMNNPNAEISVQCEDGVCKIEKGTIITEGPSVNVADVSAKIDDIDRRNKVIHLLDVLFDDDGDLLPDYSKIKIPTLLAALKNVISDLAKSSNSVSSVDIFFDKNLTETNKGKTVNKSIYELLKVTKLTKVKISKSEIGKLISKYSDESGQISLDELFQIPVIKILVYTAALGKSVGTNKDVLSWFFDDTKMDIINNTKGLKEKIEGHTRKISKIVNTILDGVDNYTQAVIDKIDNTDDLTDEEKNLQKLKAIGAEKDDKKTKGSKISDEIRSVDSKNKRKLILSKMGKTDDELKNLIESINSNEILKDGDFPLKIGNAIQAINDRWAALLSINPIFAEELYNKKFEGEGKGERLIEFLFPTTSVNGGSKSFDISGTKGSDNFEVKAYEFDADDVVKPIKLGVEGKATQSDLFNEIQVIITKLQDIFTTPNHYEILKFMINGLDAEDELKALVDRISKTLSSTIKGTKRTFKEALSSGEFSSIAITSINILLSDLHKLFDLIKENNFYYMKVIGKQNEIYKIIDSNESNGNTIFTTTQTNVKKEDEQELIESILDVLGNKNLSNNTGDFFTKVLLDLESKINTEFKQHPMILLYDTAGNDSTGNSMGIGKLPKIAEGLYDNFKIQAITRGNVAVMPVEQYFKKYGNNT